MRKLLAALVLVGCGGDGGTGIDAPAGGIDAPAAIDAPSGGAFTVTSMAYADGGAIPAAQACASKGGMDLSPQLTFANPPAGTLSYAVTLTDLTNALVHAAIYDVPLSAGGLPTDVDKVYAPPDVPGAHQTNNYSGTRGYAGPCPPAAHMYQFKVYALSTPTLTGATMTTTKDQVVTMAATNLGTATLTGTFTPP
jgi:hypothetical protein